MTAWRASFRRGFETGKGWKEETSRGAAFLAPFGNLEFIDGQFPATADVLVEVTALDAVHQAAAAWLRAQMEKQPLPVCRPSRHHWKSQISPSSRNPDRVQLLGLDRSGERQASRS